MVELHIDFETCSEVPIANLYAYVTHPSTQVHCMAYAFIDRSVKAPIVVDIVKFRNGVYKISDVILKHIKKGGMIVAHNAMFERLIMKHVLGIETKYEQWKCTAVLSSIYGAPRSLANAATFLGLKEAKQDTKAMMSLAITQNFDYDGQHKNAFEALYEYCIQDVKVQITIDDRLWSLWEQEVDGVKIIQQYYANDQRINDSGIAVDLDAISRASVLVEHAKRESGKMLADLTGRQIDSCSQHIRFKKFLADRCGVLTDSTDMEHIDQLLDKEDLPDLARNILTIKRDYGGSAFAKYDAMKERALNSIHGHSRIYGEFVFYGAHTGRASGSGVQLQNLPRGNNELIDFLFHEALIPFLDNPDMIASITDASMADVLKTCIRPMLVAQEGYVLIGCDYSSVEPRVLAWLANAYERLENIKKGVDQYKITAAQLFNIPVEKVGAERQAGKTAELALGYGGGVKAYMKMDKTGVSEDTARRLVIKWQENNPEFVKLWNAYESAALKAIKMPGTTQNAYKCSFKYAPAAKHLIVVLPSGRKLVYPGVKLELDERGFEKITYAAFDTSKKIAYRENMWGGSLTNNITQATAVDLLWYSIDKATKAGLKVVSQVHDEIVIECEESKAAESMTLLKSIMSDTPNWAKEAYNQENLPLDCGAWASKRYRK